MGRRQERKLQAFPRGWIVCLVGLILFVFFGGGGVHSETLACDLMPSAPTHPLCAFHNSSVPKQPYDHGQQAGAGPVVDSYAEARLNAWRFAPVLHFHPLEKYYLADAEEYISNAQMLDLQGKTVASQLDERVVLQESFEGGLAQSRHITRVNSPTQDWHHGSPFVDHISTAPVYYTLQRRSPENGHTWIFTYWFFYTMNGCAGLQVVTKDSGSHRLLDFVVCPLGFHEGDWEGIQIEVSPDLRRVTRMTFMQHNFNQVRDCQIPGQCTFVNSTNILRKRQAFDPSTLSNTTRPPRRTSSTTEEVVGLNSKGRFKSPERRGTKARLFWLDRMLEAQEFANPKPGSPEDSEEDHDFEGCDPYRDGIDCVYGPDNTDPETDLPDYSGIHPEAFVALNSHATYFEAAQNIPYAQQAVSQLSILAFSIVDRTVPDPLRVWLPQQDLVKPLNPFQHLGTPDYIESIEESPMTDDQKAYFLDPSYDGPPTANEGEPILIDLREDLQLVTTVRNSSELHKAVVVLAAHLRNIDLDSTAPAEGDEASGFSAGVEDRDHTQAPVPEVLNDGGNFSFDSDIPTWTLFRGRWGLSYLSIPREVQTPECLEPNQCKSRSCGNNSLLDLVMTLLGVSTTSAFQSISGDLYDMVVTEMSAWGPRAPLEQTSFREYQQRAFTPREQDVYDDTHSLFSRLFESELAHTSSSELELLASASDTWNAWPICPDERILTRDGASLADWSKDSAGRDWFFSLTAISAFLGSSLVLLACLGKWRSARLRYIAEERRLLKEAESENTEKTQGGEKDQTASEAVGPAPTAIKPLSKAGVPLARRESFSQIMLQEFLVPNKIVSMSAPPSPVPSGRDQKAGTSASDSSNSAPFSHPPSTTPYREYHDHNSRFVQSRQDSFGSVCCETACLIPKRPLLAIVLAAITYTLFMESLNEVFDLLEDYFRPNTAVYDILSIARVSLQAAASYMMFVDTLAFIVLFVSAMPVLEWYCLHPKYIREAMCCRSGPQDGSGHEIYHSTFVESQFHSNPPTEDIDQSTEQGSTSVQIQGSMPTDDSIASDDRRQHSHSSEPKLAGNSDDSFLPAGPGRCSIFWDECGLLWDIFLSVLLMIATLVVTIFFGVAAIATVFQLAIVTACNETAEYVTAICLDLSDIGLQVQLCGDYFVIFCNRWKAVDPTIMLGVIAFMLVAQLIFLTSNAEHSVWSRVKVHQRLLRHRYLVHQKELELLEQVEDDYGDLDSDSGEDLPGSGTEFKDQGVVEDDPESVSSNSSLTRQREEDPESAEVDLGKGGSRRPLSRSERAKQLWTRFRPIPRRSSLSGLPANIRPHFVWNNPEMYPLGVDAPTYRQDRVERRRHRGRRSRSRSSSRSRGHSDRLSPLSSDANPELAAAVPSPPQPQYISPVSIQSRRGLPDGLPLTSAGSQAERGPISHPPAFPPRPPGSQSPAAPANTQSLVPNVEPQSVELVSRPMSESRRRDSSQQPRPLATLSDGPSHPPGEG